VFDNGKHIFRSYLEGHNGSTYEVSCNTVMPLRLSSPFSVPPWSQWQLPFFLSCIAFCFRIAKWTIKSLVVWSHECTTLL